MDIVTLGAALNGSAEYVNSHFVGGTNIQIVDNPDGTQTINASGEVSAEDTVARAEIAAIKDGETLDSFGDVETALATKANTSTTYTKTEVDTALDDKVDKETGKGLSTNDYTTAEKTKLAGIAEGAEVNEIEGIKVNNTTINPDANKVVNITVPTSAADVSALPDTTKYAVALSLTINSSTFVMTGQLKDQNGDNLGTAQTIDLPLESVVVGGSYNSQTKNVVLTLQNGNTIEFSVADLVSGLQTELSTSNKLNPAFIEYDSTHRAVSDTEKSTWNSKQNALTTAQLDAVNSGIDSTKVAQIETNKNNISFIDEKIFKPLNVENNQITTSEADSAGKSKKWIVAYLPSKATITELKQLITVNDITKIKCEIWEKNDDKYTLAQTITPESISAVSAGYVVTFANITTNKESLVTYTDTSTSGCIGFKLVSGYNCDKFSADLVEVTGSDISATDTVKIFYSIKYRYPVLNKDVYVVDGSGNGDYTTVTQAVSELPSGATIFVKPGTYAENIRAFTKRVNIIGADRYKCILQSTDGRYANPVLECCCGYVANLTIQCKYINGTSQEIPTTESGAYAVHCENNGENDEFAIGDCLTFVNCDLISDFFPALGVGCFKDWSLNIINCRLTSNQPTTRAKYGADGGLGALYFHTMNGAKGIAKINIKDTIIQTTVLGNTVCAYDLDAPESGMVCELIDNTLYSAVNGFTDSIWWRGITTPFGSKISLSPISNGNTGTVFNS